MKKLIDLISEEVTKAFVECGYFQLYRRRTPDSTLLTF